MAAEISLSVPNRCKKSHGTEQSCTMAHHASVDTSKVKITEFQFTCSGACVCSCCMYDCMSGGYLSGTV